MFCEDPCNQTSARGVAIQQRCNITSRGYRGIPLHAGSLIACMVHPCPSRFIYPIPDLSSGCRRITAVLCTSPQPSCVYQVDMHNIRHLVVCRGPPVTMSSTWRPMVSTPTFTKGCGTVLCSVAASRCTLLQRPATHCTYALTAGWTTKKPCRWAIACLI